jgi:hypothetical protein
MSKFAKIESYAKAYKDACGVFSIVKMARIIKLPNGQYRVVSMKGKNLGTYKTKDEAKKRLRMVEYFKHVKASTTESYSTIMRDLNNNYNTEDVRAFQKEFKKNFDEAFLAGEEKPEEVALEKSKKFIKSENKMTKLTKISAAIQLGDTEAAGIYLDRKSVV